MSLCLLILLTGCEKVRTEYIYVKLPSSLTQPNNEPHIEQNINWGQCPVLYVELQNELRQCNTDKQAIREINNER